MRNAVVGRAPPTSPPRCIASSPTDAVRREAQHSVLVNMLWCVPGKVGGSEEYLVRQLLGLAEQPEQRWTATAAVARGFRRGTPRAVPTLRA